ncbi:MAG: PmoA family protein [Bacteroidota bacterium]
MKKKLISSFICMQLIFMVSVINAQSNVLSVEQQDERIIVRIDDVTFTSYRYGDGQKYPYFYPLNGPTSGVSLTTESNLPYPHHRSLWFACDRVNGGNYWQEGNDRGQIISRVPKVLENSPEKIVIADTCDWKQPDKNPIMQDEREIVITAPTDDLRIIDFTITLKALTEITILNTNHSLFSARMDHNLSVKGGGVLVNAEAKFAEKGTAGIESAWCDYYGERFGLVEGVAIFDSPQNMWYPSKWFTRDYGFFSPTNMHWKEGDFIINKSESVTFKYRVVIHSGTTEQAEIKELYSQWVKALYE